jgi:hypothetical protein
VESDTEGVPGRAPVTMTILEKIEKCDILPGITFVAKPESGKLIPNANVMFEAGYAMHALTFKAMMPIMNSFNGPPEKLPFDMGHLRHPLTYWVEPTAKNAERRDVRARLTKDLEEKLRMQIAATSPPLAAPLIFPRAHEKDGPSRFRSKGEAIGQRWNAAPFGASLHQEVSLSDGPAMWLRLFPKINTGKRWPRTNCKSPQFEQVSCV